jgi:hypothetical protein
MTSSALSGLRLEAVGKCNITCRNAEDHVSALEDAATPSEEARAHRGLVIAHARLAPGETPPDVPASVLQELREAAAITAVLGLQRSDCSKLFKTNF